jgi:hypothetical protein
MLLFFLVIFFSFLANYVFIAYDELFLLSLYFLIFFFIIYIYFKNKFKLFNIFKILKKYILFITLFKVNLNYNKLLLNFLRLVKNLFNKFTIKLIIYRRVISIILNNLFNKYVALINILFLFFFKDANNIKKYLALYIYILVDKISLNDISFYN